MGDDGAQCPQLCLSTQGSRRSLGGCSCAEKGRVLTQQEQQASPSLTSAWAGEKPALASRGLGAELSRGSMFGNPSNGGHTGPRSLPGALFPWASCCGDAPRLAAPNTSTP